MFKGIPIILILTIGFIQAKTTESTVLKDSDASKQIMTNQEKQVQLLNELQDLKESQLRISYDIEKYQSDKNTFLVTVLGVLVAIIIGLGTAIFAQLMLSINKTKQKVQGLEDESRKTIEQAQLDIKTIIEDAKEKLDKIEKKQKNTESNQEEQIEELKTLNNDLNKKINELRSSLNKVQFYSQSAVSASPVTGSTVGFGSKIFKNSLDDTIFGSPKMCPFCFTKLVQKGKNTWKCPNCKSESTEI